jgi:hypothetical protein
MIRGEPDRPRVGADVRDAQRTRLADECAEEPVAGRWITERGALLGSDPDRDELLDRPAIGREHTQGSIPGAREVHRELDDPLEHRIEGQLRSERHPGLDQPPVALLRVPPGHGARVAQAGPNLSWASPGPGGAIRPV